MNSETKFTVMRDLVIANRILANEGVVDAFGHISVRHPENPERYIMACSRSPGIVTQEDLMEYTLDGDPLTKKDLPMYAERFIHGGVYERRPDIHAVVHNHSHTVIPFGVTGIPIRPIIHVGASVAGDVPIWDIHDKFGDTSLLVLNMEHARDLAACIGDDNQAALMRGHGCVVGGKNVKEATLRSIYLEVNAKLQLQSEALGTPRYLTPGEVEQAGHRMTVDLAINRAWEYWTIRAGCQDL
jgi:ribulose-5-phosphate 4-epimerase/fuculose-1-phosphate aldolase